MLGSFTNVKTATRIDAGALVPPFVPIIACALTSLGEVTTVLEMLAGYYLARGPWRAAHQNRPVTAILFIASTAPLRDDPRFGNLLRDTGLERYWTETRTSPDYRRFA